MAGQAGVLEPGQNDRRPEGDGGTGERTDEAVPVHRRQQL